MGACTTAQALPPLLKVKRLHPDAQIPEYATSGAACFDLPSLQNGHVLAGCSEHFQTGLAFEVPAGCVMLIYSRSGHGFKNATRLVNCVGVIDSDYRGEIIVGLMNDGGGMLNVRKGDRIAQAMLVPVHQWELQEVDELSDTARGTGRFGSTGL